MTGGLVPGSDLLPESGLGARVRAGQAHGPKDVGSAADRGPAGLGTPMQQPALAGTPSLLEEVFAATGIRATPGPSLGPSAESFPVCS